MVVLSQTEELPDVVSLDRKLDETSGVEYFGNATRIEGDRYRCLAGVNGKFYLVEVVIKRIEP